MLILHGENVVESRRQLNEEITAYQGEIVRLEGEKVSLTELKQALESDSLFGHQRLVIIEKIFLCRPGQEKEAIISYLKKTSPANLIIWEPKAIDRRHLIPFSQAKIRKFNLTPYIFRFLESLEPGTMMGWYGNDALCWMGGLKWAGSLLS